MWKCSAVQYYRWVTFTGELGDLELISAYPYSWEVQSVVTYGGDPTPLGGSFSVEFGGFSSEELPYDVTADGFQAALEALPGAGRVDVSKIVLGNGRNEWMVTFRLVAFAHAKDGVRAGRTFTAFPSAGVGHSRGCRLCLPICPAVKLSCNVVPKNILYPGLSANPSVGAGKISFLANGQNKSVVSFEVGTLSNHISHDRVSLS